MNKSIKTRKTRSRGKNEKMIAGQGILGIEGGLLPLPWQQPEGMRFVLSVLAVCSLSLLALNAAAEEFPQADFYVSPEGDDAADGSEGHPFATVARAQQAVRVKVAEGLADDVVVFLRQGTFFLDETLVFDERDSGTAEHLVVYAAYPGDEVRVVGGVQLQPEWFAPVTDAAVLARLPGEAVGYVFAADLSAHGITDYGVIVRRGFAVQEGPFDDRSPISAMELFCDGQPMQLARWPNAGYERVAGTPDGTEGYQFTYSGTRPERWTEASDVWFYGYWSAFWADAFLPAESIDTGEKTVTFRPVTEEEVEEYGWDEEVANGGYGIEVGRPYYALNLLEEIDQPGEYYLDRLSGMLYFYPPAELAYSTIYVSTLDKLVVLENAAHLTFQNIAFAVSRGNMIEIADGHDNTLDRCLLGDSGAYAAAVSGERNGVAGCKIAEASDGGLGLKGGDRSTLTPCGNFVSNSQVHNYGRWTRMYSMAATLSGVGITVSHNLIHNAPHMALIYEGNEHMIELNEIQDVCTATDDAGAIYTGRDWGARGTVIRHNFIHDIRSSLNPLEYGVIISEGVHAIYFDDLACGSRAIGNVIYRVQKRGIMIGGGRDNRMENNILSDCGSAFFIDRRGQEMQNDDDFAESMWNKIERYNYTEPPWSVYYPELAAIEENDPWEPVGNIIARTMGHDNGQWIEEGYWGSTVIEVLVLHKPRSFLRQQDNIEDASDPGYQDEARLDLQLRSDSPAYGIPGFEDIPFDQIGLQPAAPTLYLVKPGSEPFFLEEGGVLEARGYCEPWAHIVRATIDGRDVLYDLTVGVNGAIYGLLTLGPTEAEGVWLEVVVADPKGHESPPGVSNSLGEHKPSADGDDEEPDGGIVTDGDDVPDGDDAPNGDDEEPYGDPSTDGGAGQGACGCCLVS